MSKALMGTLSPAYGMGDRGRLFGNAVGTVPAIAQHLRNEEEEKKKKKQQDGPARFVGKQMKKGGKVSSASKRADGCAKRGKTKCKMI
jgi:hypothetical protein